MNTNIQIMCIQKHWPLCLNNSFLHRILQAMEIGFVFCTTSGQNRKVKIRHLVTGEYYVLCMQKNLCNISIMIYINASCCWKANVSSYLKASLFHNLNPKRLFLHNPPIEFVLILNILEKQTTARKENINQSIKGW